MKITTKDIAYFAGKLLEVLEREGINSSGKLAAIAKRGKQEFPTEGKEKDQEVVIIESRPSQKGTFAETISYTVKGLGIPLEVKINQDLNYTRFIIKSIDTIPGYTRFAHDVFGNIAQENPKMGFGFKDVLSHLAELKSYKRD